MADGKIYITISDTRGGSNEVETANAAAKNNANSSGKTALGLMAFNKFIDFAQTEANQYVNFTIGNIGNFTGSYSAQKEMEVTMKYLNYFSNLGISSVGTFINFTAASGSPLAGGIAATAEVILKGAITLIDKGIFQEKAEQFNMRRTNRNISLMRQRLGLEGLTDGSRTGS